LSGEGTRGRFDSLDSVRGIASVAVVFNHCLNVFPQVGGASLGQSESQPGPVVEFLLWSPLSLVWHGKGAVAIFFVLSGFVLALPWLRGRPPPYDIFVLRRFCRIYLPYAAAVALAMVLATVLASPSPPLLSAWFDANWMEPVTFTAIVDHLLMLGPHNTFDNAVWSLNHEMRISLLFPILLLPLLRFGLPGAAVAAFGLYGTAGAITHFVGWHGAPAEIAATIRFCTFFILGAALARSVDWLRSACHAHTAWMSLCAGLLFLWGSSEPIVMALGSALVILSAVLPGPVQSILLRPSLRTLGRISYSLYLVHLLVILTAVHLLAGRVPLPAIVAGGFAASLLVAVLFNYWIEAPSDRLGRYLARRL
jgi:peptidoglycan/LPS O-acetylase OafA/YrhL